MQEWFLTWIQFYDNQFKKDRGSEVDAVSFPRSCRGHILFSAIALSPQSSQWQEKECNIDLNNLD